MKERQELVVEHLKQITEMLESAEIPFEQLSDNLVVLDNGIEYIFDENGMLSDIVVVYD